MNFEEYQHRIEQFLKNEIELYGDELVLPRDAVQALFDVHESQADWQSIGDLAQFHSAIKDCLKCPLGGNRIKFVFGSGNPAAEIMLIGEAPGADEDRQGLPFVGKAGQLLDKILAAVQLDRNEVYIGNIIKCRPPQNRDPLPQEIEACLPYLHKQIELVDPTIILCLGRIAAQTLLRTTESLGRLRSKVHDYFGRKLIVTYHPAALLRYPQYKRDTWEDVQLLQRIYIESKK